MTYFKNLSDLLKVEREEDRQSYLRLTETSSVSDRRAGGLSWYPIAIRGQEMSRGDYLTVEVERTTHQDVPHQLRFGVPAALFSNHDPKIDRVEGVISHLSGNRLKITLRTDELPEWSRQGKLGIDLLFDDNSYDEMQNAVKAAGELLENEKEGRLVRILTGRDAPAFDLNTPKESIPSLNSSQISAVDKILAARDLAIVHGPPGTGKTTTLVQAIKKLWERERKQILVVAPSNTAVDLLSEKLTDAGLNVLRVGNPVRVSERLMSLTLDSRMSGHPMNKDIKKLKKQASEFKNMAHKYKRNFGKSERDQRKALFDEAHRIMKDVGQMEQHIIDNVVSRSQVITATLVGANHYTVRNLRYKTVVIDEAGQALEPACWIPILKAEKVVLAGDHFQLPPTIKSVEAARAGLSTTLLEKCAVLHTESVTLLEEQYRMNESIMGFSSREFYGNRLKAHASVATRTLFAGDEPLAFIDTAGCGYDEKLQGTSSVNPEEAAFLLRHLSGLVRDVDHALKNTGGDFPSVAVISPYKEQINTLRSELANFPELVAKGDHISVNTIDSFQGQERDVVYISMVRSNSEGEIGFLSDIRRMNVAMTRARKKLVIIGDSATLGRFPFYSDFITYAEGLNAYHSAWEFADL